MQMNLSVKFFCTFACHVIMKSATEFPAAFYSGAFASVHVAVER